MRSGIGGFYGNVHAIRWYLVVFLFLHGKILLFCDLLHDKGGGLRVDLQAVAEYPVQKSAGREFHVTDNDEPLLLMELVRRYSGRI